MCALPSLSLSLPPPPPSRFLSRSHTHLFQQAYFNPKAFLLLSTGRQTSALRYNPHYLASPDNTTPRNTRKCYLRLLRKLANDNLGILKPWRIWDSCIEADPENSEIRPAVSRVNYLMNLIEICAWAERERERERERESPCLTRMSLLYKLDTSVSLYFLSIAFHRPGSFKRSIRCRPKTFEIAKKCC